MRCIRGRFLIVFVLLVEAKDPSGGAGLVCIVDLEMTIDLGSFAGALFGSYTGWLQSDQTWLGGGRSLSLHGRDELMPWLIA